MYIPGIGLEDFETCERLFSISNGLARGTRHASPFHRYQAIEEFFRFWDEDKYANLGKFFFTCRNCQAIDRQIGYFLCNNYAQAQDIISRETPILNMFKSKFALDDADFEHFLEEERQYLQVLKEPRQYDNEMHIVYVEALEALEASQ